MSFWTIAFFIYLVLSVTAFVLIMGMLILGKRSEQRRPRLQGEAVQQPAGIEVLNTPYPIQPPAY